MQYNCGDATAHELEEESHPRRGRNESKDFEAFQVVTRI